MKLTELSPEQVEMLFLQTPEEDNVLLVDPEGEILGWERFEDYIARGRVVDCDCSHLQCCCEAARRHVLGCQRRLAITCAVPITCEPHGLDVCETCDPCSCPPRPKVDNQLTP